jgi:hypothetical protein
MYLVSEQPRFNQTLQRQKNGIFSSHPPHFTHLSLFMAPLHQNTGWWGQSISREALATCNQMKWRELKTTMNV